MLSTILFVLISVMLGAMGQVLWKRGLGLLDFAPTLFFDPKGWVTILRNGWIPAGIVCYILSMISYLGALSKGELSRIYPFMSLNFVILSVVGYFLFHENVSMLRIIGVLLIFFGVIIVARS